MGQVDLPMGRAPVKGETGPEVSTDVRWPDERWTCNTPSPTGS
jgi:hypothetical protein